MTEEKNKYFFVADSHLGSLLFEDKEAKNLRFVEWLDTAAKEAAEIFLLGDIFDFWFEFAHSIPPGFDSVLNKLKDLTSRGLKIHFFCGNHDQWTFNYLEQHCGLIIHRKGEKIQIGDKTFFLAHGHGLGEKRFGAKVINRIFESRPLQWCFRHLVIPRLGLAFGYKWSSNNRKKHEKSQRKYEYHDYYQAQGSDDNSCFQIEWAKAFSKENPDVNYIMMGHLHKETNLRLANGAQLLILDEFYERYGYAVYDGSNLYACNFE